MARARKNASVETRFGGERGNPIGRTAEQREIEIRNAWIATELRAQTLAAVQNALKTVEQNGDILKHIDLLKLLKDTEDRGLGAPKASIDHTTNGEKITSTVDLNVLSSAALEELIAARDAAKKT